MRQTAPGTQRASRKARRGLPKVLSSLKCHRERLGSLAGARGHRQAYAARTAGGFRSPSPRNGAAQRQPHLAAVKTVHAPERPREGRARVGRAVGQGGSFKLLHSFASASPCAAGASEALGQVREAL